MGPLTHVLARFIVFMCIWDCFITAVKLGAKRAELVHLVQKFERQSRVGIFRNERTQTSPYDPKLIIWRVS